MPLLIGVDLNPHFTIVPSHNNADRVQLCAQSGPSLGKNIFEFLGCAVAFCLSNDILK